LITSLSCFRADGYKLPTIHIFARLKKEKKKQTNASGSTFVNNWKHGRSLDVNSMAGICSLFLRTS